MRESFISKTMIKDWLFSYHEAEKEFEDYFKRYGKLYPYDAFCNNRKFEFLETDLKSINTEFKRLNETKVLSEMNWFNPFMDVAIHKHMRYFPEFLHSHDFYEACYVLSGECTQEIYQANVSYSIQLKQGDVLILPPSSKHSIKVINDCVVINILIRQSTFDMVFLRNIPDSTLLYNFFLQTLYSNNKPFYFLAHSEDDIELVNIFYVIAEEYCNKDVFSNNIINLNLGLFFLKLIKNHAQNIEFLSGHEKCSDYIPDILYFIDMHYATSSVRDIAEHFNMNEAYLSRIFKEYVGVTLTSTLQQKRVNKASQLLLTTNLSVAEVANVVGYQDQTYFIRLFKKIHGVTPAIFRDKY